MEDQLKALNTLLNQEQDALWDVEERIGVDPNIYGTMQEMLQVKSRIAA
jgi:hypothetical protein